MISLFENRATARAESTLLDWVIGHWRFTPIRITFVYLVFGIAALYLSDVVLVQRFSDPLLGQLQALKGGVEVLITAGLIFGLTSTRRAQVERSKQKIDRQREELLVLHRVLRHNLRNDLNVILGYSQHLMETVDSDSAREKSAAIWRSASKLSHYTAQAERIRKVTTQNGRSITLDLGEAVSNRVDGHPHVTDAVSVEVDEGERSTVSVNHMFLDAIDELIRNAVQHNDRDELAIDISVDPDAGPIHLIEFTVTDTGSGIPDHVVAILNSSEYDQLTHLEGMGLWFVYWTVLESGGSMTIEDGPEGGARVRIRVPRASLADHVGTLIDAV